MELELKGTQLSGFSPVVSTSLFSEETLESIVPDACPDILRVLDTGAYVCIRSREAREGRLELRGTVYAQVLYLPDGEEGVRHMDVSIPFSCHLDHSDIHSDCLTRFFPEILSADARVLNPRKVYVRAELIVGVEVYAPWQKKAVSGCLCSPELGVQERRELCRLCMAYGVQYKNFTFSDDLTLPAGKPDLQEVLTHSVTAACTESRVIGSKLILKGLVRLDLLYLDSEHQPVSVNFDLPFSQVLDAADAGEGASCESQITLGEISCQADPESPRTISVSMNLLAQAVVRDTREVELLTDLYSTTRVLTPQFREEELCVSSEDGTAQVEVREVVETPVPAKAAVRCAVSLGGVTQSWEGTQLCFTADARVHLIYQGEDGDYYALTRAIPAAVRLEAEAGCTYFPRCRCVGERYVTPVTGGLEVRLSLDILYRAEVHRRVRTVVGAEAEESDREDRERPSIVLRMAAAGESLWDLAKAYSTTMEEVRQANDLNEPEEICGRILLIPQKR